MSLSFERCVGPHRDVRELEYICALQQTTKADLRSSATVTAEDVVDYLRSRHGLEVNLNYLKEVFMPGLAGALGVDDDGDADPVFDIVELTCILLIPHFKRQARYYKLNRLISRNTARLIGAGTQGNNNRGGGGRGGRRGGVLSRAISGRSGGQAEELQEGEEGDDPRESYNAANSSNGTGPTTLMTVLHEGDEEEEEDESESAGAGGQARVELEEAPVDLDISNSESEFENEPSPEEINWTRSTSPSSTTTPTTTNTSFTRRRRSHAVATLPPQPQTVLSDEDDDESYNPGRRRRQRLERRNRRAALKAARRGETSVPGEGRSTRTKTASGRRKEDFFQALYNIVIKDLEIEGKLPASPSPSPTTATTTTSSSIWGQKQTNNTNNTVGQQSMRVKTHHNRRDLILTPELMRSILEIYGEGEGVSDNDIQSMIEAATPPPPPTAAVASSRLQSRGVLFTPETLARACTADLEHYKVGWEDRDSTHFDDVFKGTYLDQKGINITKMIKKRTNFSKTNNQSSRLGGFGSPSAFAEPLDESYNSHYSESTINRDSSATNNNNRYTRGASMDNSFLGGSMFSLGGSEMEEKPDIKKIKTWASIDGIAENYRSIFFSVLIWITLLVLYAAYVYGENNNMALHSRLECSTLTKKDEDGKEKITLQSFFCQVGDAVLTWVLILLQLATLGSIFVILGSAGNSIHAKHDIMSILHMLAAMAFIYFVCIVSYLVPYKNEALGFNTERGSDSWYDLDDTTGVLIIILGCLLMSFQIKTLLAIGVPTSWYDSAFVQEVLASDMGSREGKTKQAARFKVDKMVKNALAMHKSSKSLMVRNSTLTKETIRNLGNGWEGGNPLLAFASLADERETVGGIKWTVKKMWDGTLFEEEGVWLHARLWACNSVQVLVIGWFSVVLPYFYYITFLKEEDSLLDQALDSVWDQAYQAAAPYWEPYVEAFVANFNQFDGALQDTLWNNTNATLITNFTSEILKAIDKDTLYSTLAELDLSTLLTVADISTQLLDQAGLGNKRELASSQSEDNTNDYFQYYYQAEDYAKEQEEYWVPEDWQLMVPFLVASIAAVSVTVHLAVVWIPSSVCTILRFRSGDIGSFRDKHFYKYRESLDQISLLLGSVFWGSLYSGFLLFGTFGFVTFLFFWEPSQTVMINFAATLLAIIITLSLRIILLCFISALFNGFYRRNPAWSSFFMVILECWSLGTTVFTLVTRLVLMIILAAAYVGRLDAAVFAKGVDSVAFRLLEDRYPLLIRKDILIHEAHRHPFIERLGTLYMLKLKHGDEFGRAPESAWRMILTLAMMPWLRKFRYDEDDYDEDGNLKEESLRRGSVARRRSTVAVLPVLHKSEEMAALRRRVSLLERQNQFLLNETQEDHSMAESSHHKNPSRQNQFPLNETREDHIMVDTSSDNDPSLNYSLSNEHPSRRVSRYDTAPGHTEFETIIEC